MRYGLLLLIFLIGIVSDTEARQTGNRISGQVKDRTGAPVVSANVVVLKDSNVLVKAGLTDTEGRFLIEGIPEGKYYLKVSLIGYEPYSSAEFQLVGSNDLGEIVMGEFSSTLKEVSVRASRPFIEVRADMLIVNVENSIVSAGSSAMEVLQRSPGVTVDNNDNISLKGKQGVMIWIDGKQTPMSGTDLATVLRSMPASSIDKIEIISNPGARYDAAGNAGIINIRTKRDQRLGTNGSVNLTYGQGVYPKYGAGISVNHRNKKVNLYGSYNYARRYWFNHLMLDRRFLNVEEGNKQEFRYDQDNYALFDFNNHIANAGIDYSISQKTSIGLSVNGVTNSFNPKADNNSRALDGNDNLIYNFKTKGRHENFYYNYSANAFFRHQFDSSGRELSVDFDYAAFGNDSKQHFETSYEAPEGSVPPADYYLNSDLQGITQIRSVKADYRQPLSGNARFEAGVKAAYVTADNEPLFFEKAGNEFVLDLKRSNHFIYNENINAAYVNLQKELKKFSLQLGVRA